MQMIWSSLHLELLEVFGEIDRARIKLLHLVYIMVPVRVIVSSQDQVGEYNALYLRARRQFANFRRREMILAQMPDTANLALGGHCVPYAALL
jgi:hypothetical protein